MVFMSQSLVRCIYCATVARLRVVDSGRIATDPNNRRLADGIRAGHPAPRREAIRTCYRKLPDGPSDTATVTP